MVPLAMAAAFGAAKLNECRFLSLRERWKDQRSYDRICYSIDLSWCAEQMKIDRVYGSSSSDRLALMNNFYALQTERNDCMLKIITLQGELPFTSFPFQTIAKVRECWSLRSRFQKLNREINRPHFRGQLPLLAAPSELASERIHQTPQFHLGDPTFLARCSTHWLVSHASNFQTGAYQNCISHLKTPQLDALNGQLQIFCKERVEQIWGQMVKRSERLMIVMTFLQTGFLGAIRFGFGSAIAAHCFKQAQAQELAKIFLVSSRVFGLASLVSAIAMGFAVRFYGSLLLQNKEKVAVINQVKELMEHYIRMIRERRFQEIALAGFEMLNRREKKLIEMGEQIARDAQRHARTDQMIEQLKGKSHEQSLELLAQNSRLDEIDRELSEQSGKLSERDRELSEQRGELDKHISRISENDRKLSEQRGKLDKHISHISENDRELSEQSGKLSERDRELSEQRGELDKHISRISENDRKLSEQRGTLNAQTKMIDNLTDKFKALESLVLAKAS